MTEWKARTITDRQCEEPDRYEVFDSATGKKLYLCQIKPYFGPKDKAGTLLNREYLQPVEDFMQTVSQAVSQVEARMAALETALETANARHQKALARMEELAPLDSPCFASPRANTVPVSWNNKTLCTTQSVKTYLDGLMAQYRQV